jgi:hypothetical protein
MVKTSRHGEGAGMGAMAAAAWQAQPCQQEETEWRCILEPKMNSLFLFGG